MAQRRPLPILSCVINRNGSSDISEFPTSIRRVGSILLEFRGHWVCFSRHVLIHCAATSKQLAEDESALTGLSRTRGAIGSSVRK